MEPIDPLIETSNPLTPATYRAALVPVFPTFSSRGRFEMNGENRDIGMYDTAVVVRIVLFQ